jgi:hypothetical protein
MLFGDPADFAIEADVEPDLTPPSSVWGQMCVWCRGFALGRLAERYCGLGFACDRFDWLATHLDELWTPELAAFDYEGIWRFLDSLLYGYHGELALDEHDRRTLSEVSADSHAFGRFDFLTNWGEQFDGGFKSFIFRPPGGRVHILSRAFPANMGLCVQVTPEGLVAATTGFVEWFREQELRLQTNG